MLDLFDKGLNTNNICLRDGSEIVKVELNNDSVPKNTVAYVHYDAGNGKIEKRLYSNKNGECHCCNECDSGRYDCYFDIILRTDCKRGNNG